MLAAGQFPFVMEVAAPRGLDPSVVRQAGAGTWARSREHLTIHGRRARAPALATLIERQAASKRCSIILP
jgi:hypothetical protein